MEFIFGIIILILDIWAIVRIAGSSAFEKADTDRGVPGRPALSPRLECGGWNAGRGAHVCQRKSRSKRIMEFIFGIIILILDIWAIVRIAGSSASTGAKILWVLLILILPLLGLIIWYFAGPRDRAGVRY